MILIATYDSAVHSEKPRFHRPMPAGPQVWALKLWALGANGEKHESLTKLKSKCEYHDLREQHIEKCMDEMRAACGGIRRFKFWLWKAR
ncbi:MAG: hypothetical protein JWM78_1629 [Verrucomicrobiaceae bacterium]|nr:hypothetical protein [Verrucomicrobiaceae bacterium]